MNELTQGQKDDLNRLMNQVGVCAVLRVIAERCDHIAAWLHNPECSRDKYRAKEYANNARLIRQAEKEMVF